jgi:hypothetical protein
VVLVRLFPEIFSKETKTESETDRKTKLETDRDKKDSEIKTALCHLSQVNWGSS